MSSFQMVRHFVHVVRQLPNTPDLPMDEVSLLSPEDHSGLARWNGFAPEHTETTINTVFQASSSGQPDLLVSYTEDGDMT